MRHRRLLGHKGPHVVARSHKALIFMVSMGIDHIRHIFGVTISQRFVGVGCKNELVRPTLLVDMEEGPASQVLAGPD